MSCLGVLFALSVNEESNLLAASGDREALLIVREIESRWDSCWLCELGKSWEGIHRALTSGQLNLAHDTYPLSHAILSGRRLYFGDDYIVSYVSSSQVKQIAKALGGTDLEVFRKGYELIDRDNGEYSFYGDEDFDYCYEYFTQMQAFYAKAAEHDRATIFTADQ